MMSEWLDGLRKDWIPWATLSGVGWCALGIYYVANVTIGPGVIGGILLMLGGGVWLVLGLAANRIFIYPLGMLVVGAFTFIGGFFRRDA